MAGFSREVILCRDQFSANRIEIGRRGRLGVMVTSNVMAFATGGVALSQLNYFMAHSDNAIGPGIGGGSVSRIKAGWVVGEVRSGGLRGPWSIKTEFLYVVT